MNEERDEATMAPTPNRIKRAAEHGMVPYSSQLATAIQFFVGLYVLWLCVGLIGSSISEYTTGLWTSAAIGTSGISLNFVEGLQKLALVMVAIGAVVVVVAVGSQILQKGFVLPRRQLFDLSGLSPFGRKQTMSILDRCKVFALRIVQAGLISVVLWNVTKNFWPDIIGLWQRSGNHWLDQMIAIVFGPGLIVAAAFLLLATTDYGLRRVRHWQQLKMTPEEFREENRMEEGHPDIKRQRRQRQADLRAIGIRRTT